VKKPIYLPFFLALSILVTTNISAFTFNHRTVAGGSLGMIIGAAYATALSALSIYNESGSNKESIKDKIKSYIRKDKYRTFVIAFIIIALPTSFAMGGAAIADSIFNTHFDRPGPDFNARFDRHADTFKRIHRVSAALTTLGIDPASNYTRDNINTAYRASMLKNHPDKQVNATNEEKMRAHETALRLNEARDYLRAQLK
jgi:hypothetical protein